MIKNVLLTGASGTVGFEVLKQLIVNGKYNITVFDVENKNSKKKFVSQPQNFNLVFGRHDDLKSYFKSVSKKVNLAEKALTLMVNPIVKRRLLRESEPYAAFKTNYTAIKERFFN